MLVSHDRAFIRAVCREIVELENGKFVRYPFGYDKYVVERDARLERARAAYERQKEHVEKTEDFIRRNLAGQKTKQAQSRRKMLEKLDRLERPDDQWEHAGQDRARRSRPAAISAARRPSARPSSPSATAGAPPILRDVTANIYRGDKVGIVGPNGSGKSTLLKTLIGELPPLAGQVEIGTGVRIGYFDQKLGTLDEDLSLMDEIRSVRADLSPEVVRQYLAKFRFFGDDPFRTVRGLSGGERSRLAMAKIMLFPRNVLVLDEPTNHLDIPARETLEEALDELRGHADRRQPRSLLPRPGLHPPAGHRRRPARGAPRQLQRLAPAGPRERAGRGGPGARRSRPRSRASEARPCDRRAARAPTRTASASAGAWRGVWRRWRRM